MRYIFAGFFIYSVFCLYMILVVGALMSFKASFQMGALLGAVALAWLGIPYVMEYAKRILNEKV